MVRVAVVDDEKIERETLNTYLSRFSSETGARINVDQFSSGDALLTEYRLIYDIILFDIDMPGTNGIDTARQVRKLDENVTILFITNIAQYAINAFEVEAVDYILKPIEYFDFALKFQRAVKRAARRGGRELALDTTEGVRNVSAANIVYVEAFDHYLTYHLRDSVSFEVRGSMRDHEALLRPYGFVRIHKSYLVNLACVDTIRTSEVLAHGFVIPIGRQHKKNLMGEYFRFLRG